MKLFFRRFGEGDPLVILHGLFGLSDNWVTIGKSLSAHHSVYIPDLRNHGQSPHSQLFTLGAMVEDLAEFIEGQCLGKCFLLGHSLGGLVAMHFALNHPELVRELVVVDISLRRQRDFSEHQGLIEAMKGVDFSLAPARSDVERQLAGKIPSKTLRQFLLKNVYWRDRDHLAWRLNLDVLADSLPIELPDHGHMEPFRRKALFIKGGESEYIRGEDMQEILEKFPAARLKTIQGAGHWVHADAPAEFLEIILDFLHSRDG